ncbi:hypothetical protein QR64_18930, partial [Rhodococcus sp. Chr-9]
TQPAPMPLLTAKSPILRTVTGVLIITTLTNGMVIGAVHPYLQQVVQGLVVIVAVAVTLDRKKLDLVK